MSYKPTQEDIEFAKNIYETIIKTQVLNPFKIKEAYKRLFGEDASSPAYAKSRVYAYFQYTYKAVDVTESVSMVGSAADTSQPQSHSENLHDGDKQEVIQEYKPKARGRKKKT